MKLLRGFVIRITAVLALSEIDADFTPRIAGLYSARYLSTVFEVAIVGYVDS